ncbi:Hypothetical predicted protein, partial [Paramuricea clavata]
MSGKKEKKVVVPSMIEISPDSTWSRYQIDEFKTTRHNKPVLFEELDYSIYKSSAYMKFKLAINRSISSKGGILAHMINDSQLTSYIMDKMQDFALRDGKEVIASLVIGRQPNFRTVDIGGEFVDKDDPTAVTTTVDDPDTAVYVLNDKLQ